LAAASAPITIADQALLDALRVWGGDAGPRFWRAIRPSWRARLVSAREASPPVEPGAALDRLRNEHQAEARPDLGCVHPTWWARALKDETPAVRLSVAAGLEPDVRESLREALALPAGEIATDHPAHPEALQGARSLWAERLVGHRSDPDRDPPVVVALTCRGFGAVARLFPELGLAKWALSGEEPTGLRTRDTIRIDHFRAAFGTPDPEHRRLARRDLAELDQTARTDGNRLGLITVARLLTAVEPYLVRWTLQHLPYSIAKFMRTLMASKRRTGADAATELAMEAEVLRAVMDRIRAEGGLRDDRGSPP
jgi:hypothetical protein